MKETELRANIALLTETFVSASKLKASTVLSRAANDARFLERTGGGKTFTVRVYDNALQWFADNWPAQADWPADIPRPERTPAGAPA